ncbi:hypothetical protein [Seonamhaeicola marinus]|uniref:STAS/SEC14 domain-containing protein n=1 Tax=Seonamhaeicola marinus TaxID=1912246 RepID=A0A5D0I4V9_9FLAO|nr:hypothetical protein [Seonamhaeicola marinus]TYA78783.1 hypothetical protein FUA24_10550 [Seonamhaeicola marinus]
MKFESTSYFKQPHYKLEMPFGNYYLFEKFIIGELYEGVHFDWTKTKLVVEELISFYGKDCKIGFISNRVNRYSVDPQNWTNIEKEYNIIAASAIITYNLSTQHNASLEKRFSDIKIKQCFSIKEAIEWMSELKELN